MQYSASQILNAKRFTFIGPQQKLSFLSSLQNFFVFKRHLYVFQQVNLAKEKNWLITLGLTITIVFKIGFGKAAAILKSISKYQVLRRQNFSKSIFAL